MSAKAGITLPIRKLIGDRRGATAVEAALCFPIVLALFFACFQYGVFFYTAFNLNRLMDDAARDVLLMENPTQQTILTHLTDKIPDGRADDVTLSIQVVDRYDHQFAQITMEYDHTVEIPFVKDASITSNYSNLLILGEGSAS